ncbi:DUF190 domain-containing protein [Methanococcoides burtonii]|uniref:Uncharacterized protein n=1 Tax=Methanococcoides burtonii (strain DSM 6242 / NBRC 107633 / OCM 468 / ACE-M) TaxID=259564 RepID=Q12W47_METBU|nr:DUF190 domain-containing protein [Methanococcoides burtonii]ABE52329.1 Protein of unknown function DUF190 [Methanococcoides burtonii DSM 6242]
MVSKILRIFLNENCIFDGKVAHEAILELLKEARVSGATVLHGIEGYGVHNKIHTASILRLGTQLPIIVEAIDSEEKIREILPNIRKMVPEGLITLQEVEIIH